MAKRDILIQKETYAGLCSKGEFKLKKLFDKEFKEVLEIKKVGDEFTVITKLPLTQVNLTHRYCEEAFYNVSPIIGTIDREDVVKVCRYFGEKC